MRKRKTTVFSKDRRRKRHDSFWTNLRHRISPGVCLPRARVRQGQADRRGSGFESLEYTDPVEEKIEFWLKPAQPFDWYSDSRIYPFPKVTSGNMEIVPVKNSNRTITFTIIGLSNVAFELTAPVPHCSPSGLCVIISLSSGTISLFLNGKLAQERMIPA